MTNEYRIVETDNFDRDYADEKFVTNLPFLYTQEQAQKIADAINSLIPHDHNRYWKVVKMPYNLDPPFEP